MWKPFPVLLVLLATSPFNARSSGQSSAQSAGQVTAQSAAQSDPDRDRILSLENAWNQAVQQKDAAALRMLLAPDLIYVDYDGTLMNKAQYLANVQASWLHPAHIVNESMTVHHYGTVAVVNGVCRESGTRKGKPYALLERFTDTWVLRGDSWLCVASHTSLLSR